MSSNNNPNNNNKQSSSVPGANPAGTTGTSAANANANANTNANATPSQNAPASNANRATVSSASGNVNPASNNNNSNSANSNSNRQSQAQRQQQYSQADLNKIVLEYLNKKGYHKTESMLRNESANVPIGFNQALPVSPATTGIPSKQPAVVRAENQQQQQQQSKVDKKQPQQPQHQQPQSQPQQSQPQQSQQQQQQVGPSGKSSKVDKSQFRLINPNTPSSEILSEINDQLKDPQLYFRGYKILRDWIASSLALYKPELSKLLYPIFVNCYIDLISKDKTDLAKQFFDKFKDDHIVLHGTEVVEISAISLVDHLKVNTFIKNFREKKYKVKISSICLYLLLYFLNENKYVGGELIIRVINQYLDFEISNGKLNRFDAVDNLLDPTEGIPEFNEKNIEQFNSKKLKLGKFPRDDNFDKEIENELKSKDEKETQKRKSSSAVGKKISLVDEFQKIKSEKPNPTTTGGAEQTKADADGDSRVASDDAEGGVAKRDDRKVDIEIKDDSNGTILDKMKKDDENFESPIREALPLPPKTIFDLKKEIQLVQDSRSRLKLSFDKNQFSPPSICMYTFHNSLNEITCLEFNENSNLIAAGFEDSYIKLWSIDGNPLKSIVKSDPQNKQNTRRLIGHSGTVYSLSFSPDNNYLLSASEDGTVRLWSLDTYTTLVIYKSHNDPIWDVKFSPFGHYFVTASHDTTARLWSVDHIYPLRLFVGHMSDVDCIAWFPNSCYCFTGSADKTIRMWDIMRGDCVRLFVSHTAAINALAVSPQGRILASAGEDAIITLWDIATGKVLKTMKGHGVKGSIYSLDFSKDGNVLVSGGSDNSVRVWDVKKNSEHQLSEPVPFFGSSTSTASVDVANGSVSANGSSKDASGKPALTATVQSSSLGKKNVGNANGSSLRSDSDGAANSNDSNSSRKKTKELGLCTNDHVGAYFTKQTSVYKVHFTRRNLCLAAGAFSSAEATGTLG